MDKIEIVQAIGNLVCEGCGPYPDCGIDPKECDRIAEAVNILVGAIFQQEAPPDQDKLSRLSKP